MESEEIIVAFTAGDSPALGNIWRITAKKTDFYLDSVGEVGNAIHLSAHGPNDRHPTGTASTYGWAARRPPRGGGVTSRRKLLIAGAGAVGLGALGVAGVELAPYRVKARLGLTPDPYVPDAAEGRVRLETVRSAALGGDTELFTAVPAGHGNGAGLPVVVVLHGATASVGDFPGLGFGRFLTAAVERGAPPFVLAGTDDGPNGWVPEGGGIDPQAMVLDEIPTGCRTAGTTPTDGRCGDGPEAGTASCDWLRWRLTGLAPRRSSVLPSWTATRSSTALRRWRRSRWECGADPATRSWTRSATSSPTCRSRRRC